MSRFRALQLHIVAGVLRTDKILVRDGIYVASSRTNIVYMYRIC